jgi:septum site-determining protein MinC
MQNAVRARDTMRFRGRSLLAFVLQPEAPLGDWLTELDGCLERSPGFFAGKPVVLDLAGLKPTRAEFDALMSELEGRHIRVMAVEEVDPSWLGSGMPPLLSGGRHSGLIEMQAPAVARPRQPPQPSSLVLSQPVRSGQSVIFPYGDVTVIGSVASGAEIVAGGSIHIYGVLRGRALAGSTGNAAARIFCRRAEAELLAIDGLYKTADDIHASLRGRPIQVWLEGDTMQLVALD